MTNSHEPNAPGFFTALDGVGQPTPTEPLLGHEERPCPVCGQAMAVRQERGATLDHCPGHGVWFDQDQWDRFTSRRGTERGPTRAAPVRRPVNGLGYYTQTDDLYESLFDLGGGD